MKKILNDPENFVNEMLKGLCAAHPEYYQQTGPQGRVMLDLKRRSRVRSASSQVAARDIFRSSQVMWEKDCSMQQQSVMYFAPLPQIRSQTPCVVQIVALECCGCLGIMAETS